MSNLAYPLEIEMLQELQFAISNCNYAQGLVLQNIKIEDYDKVLILKILQKEMQQQSINFLNQIMTLKRLIKEKQ